MCSKEQNQGEKHNTFLFLWIHPLYLCPAACFHSQKPSMNRGSTGANNVDAVPSPAGGARHRASSVCSPQLLSLKGSLLCQLGSEGGRGRFSRSAVWVQLHPLTLTHTNEGMQGKVAATLLVFEGVPELQKGGAVMKRDRFRSLTHCWNEYIEREGEKMLHVGEEEECVGWGEGRWDGGETDEVKGRKHLKSCSRMK